jgi:hypothetical protein
MGRIEDMEEVKTPMRLGELLILAFLWMLFGFVLWYYLSVFHGIPVRLMADYFLDTTLGDSFSGIVANADRRYLLQVETQIPFVFPDGTKQALGFIVNPLVYGYGLPLLFGLVMASNNQLVRKIVTLLVGYLIILIVQAWGVYWESLKMLMFNFGPDAQQVVDDAGISATVIALCYQLGVLIFPALAPVIVWVLASWHEVELFIGGPLQRRK